MINIKWFANFLKYPPYWIQHFISHLVDIWWFLSFFGFSGPGCSPSSLLLLCYIGKVLLSVVTVGKLVSAGRSPTCHVEIDIYYHWQAMGRWWVQAGLLHSSACRYGCSNWYFENQIKYPVPNLNSNNFK